MGVGDGGGWEGGGVTAKRRSNCIGNGQPEKDEVGLGVGVGWGGGTAAVARSLTRSFADRGIR